MSDSDDRTSPLEIHSDEDWKERVKNEDRVRDEQMAREQAPPAAAAPDPLGSLPNADFAVLTQIFISQAMAALGLFPEPDAAPPQPRLPLARHFIDLLAVLEQKTRGNLTPTEERLLSTSLHELRLIYVELSRSPDAASAAPTA